MLPVFASFLFGSKVRLFLLIWQNFFCARWFFILFCFVFPLIPQVFLGKKRKKSYSLKSLWCFLPNFIVFFLLLTLFKIVLFNVISCQLFPVTPGQFFYCQMVVMMQNRTLGCCSKCIGGILLVKCFVCSFLT